MNILFICPKDPRLTNGGGEQRTNLLWESLKQYGKVYTFLVDYRFEMDYEVIDGEHPICKLRLIEKRFSVWRIVNSILYRLARFSICNRKTVLIDRPENIFVGVHFDIVVVRYIHPLCIYKYWDIAPLLIDIDDHPFQVYDTRYKKRLPRGLKVLGELVTKWQTDYIIKKSVGGWISNQDQLVLCGNNYGYLPNIPKTPSSEYNVCSSERKDLFTVGSMDYVVNKEGVTWFLKEIWPSFHQKYPDVQYYIVGKGASETETEFWNSFENVKYLGYVENLEALYERTQATVVPVYSGGGTCIKTLEAMAYSRPCLSTEFGARGLSDDVIDQKKGVLLFDNAETFMKAYEELQTLNRRQKIEIQGKDVILNHYSVAAFNNAVDCILSRVIIDHNLSA